MICLVNSRCSRTEFPRRRSRPPLGIEVESPAHGQLRAANELSKQGVHHLLQRAAFGMAPSRHGDIKEACQGPEGQSHPGASSSESKENCQA